MAAKKISSAILWEGQSRLDGAPIVAVITGLARKSKNAKTGEMAQVFILRADMTPLQAVKTAHDYSICGACKHRGYVSIAWGIVTMLKRSCYVTVAQSPQAVYRTYAAGKYPRLSPAEASVLLAGMTVRLGAYGDPAAVPAEVWRALTVHAKGHTGYTHQWTTDGAEAYRPFVMASVDTAEEYQQAQGLGWRTFRVRTAAEELMPSEITCPASEESGYRTTCAQCRLCAGTDRPAKSIAILAHGAGAAAFVSLASLRRAS